MYIQVFFVHRPRTNSRDLVRDCAIADLFVVTRDVSVLDGSRSRSVKSIESAVRGITRGSSRARRLHPDIFHLAPPPTKLRLGKRASCIRRAPAVNHSVGQVKIGSRNHQQSTFFFFVPSLTHAKTKSKVSSVNRARFTCR